MVISIQASYCFVFNNLTVFQDVVCCGDAGSVAVLSATSQEVPLAAKNDAKENVLLTMIAQQQKKMFILK